jgi:hypothetical protein
MANLSPGAQASASLSRFGKNLADRALLRPLIQFTGSGNRIHQVDSTRSSFDFNLEP